MDDGFLNVDLEIGARSRAHLVPIVDALQDQLFELFRGRIRGLYRVHYETNARGLNASATIHELASAIEALNTSQRRAWDAATMRDFNIGIELVRGVRSVESAIDSDAVRRVAALGGWIVFSVYQTVAMPRGRLAEARTQKSQSTRARTRRRTRSARQSR